MDLAQARRRPNAVRAKAGSWARIDPLQVAQRRTGLETELTGQKQSNSAKGGEGVGGSSRLVEGEHQLTPRPLAVGMGLNERFQLPDASLTGAAGELGRHRLLDDRRVELLQSLHLPRRQRSLGHVGVWLTAERLCRLTEHVDDVTRSIIGDRLTGIGEQSG